MKARENVLTALKLEYDRLRTENNKLRGEHGSEAGPGEVQKERGSGAGPGVGQREKGSGAGPGEGQREQGSGAWSSEAQGEGGNKQQARGRPGRADSAELLTRVARLEEERDGLLKLVNNPNMFVETPVYFTGFCQEYYKIGFT